MAQATEDNKKYYQTFYIKHSDKIHTPIICELCGGKYTYFNKSKHMKIKKHLYKLMEIHLNDIYKKERMIEMEELKKGFIYKEGDIPTTL